MNNDLKKNLPYVLGTIFIVVVFALFFGGGSKAPNENDDLAQCLADKGVKMYGAWWCPHCQEQKKEFGSSFDFINYIECAVGNTKNRQTKECDDAKITGYPTWVFEDKTRLEGEQTLDKLAETAGCKISK
jgi:hypothetical protein